MMQTHTLLVNQFNGRYGFTTQPCKICGTPTRRKRGICQACVEDLRRKSQPPQRMSKQKINQLKLERDLKLANSYFELPEV